MHNTDCKMKVDRGIPAGDVVRICSSEPVVKVHDIAFVRFSCPDLDIAQAFIEDFGLQVVHRTEDVMYSRGIAGAPFHHGKCVIGSLRVAKLTAGPASIPSRAPR